MPPYQQGAFLYHQFLLYDLHVLRSLMTNKLFKFTALIFAFIFCLSFTNSATAKTELDRSLFDIPDVTTQDKATTVPFYLDCMQDGKATLKCGMTVDSGAYIYQDSLKLTSNNGVLLTLPEPRDHTDANGTVKVFDSSFIFYVQLTRGEVGESVNFTYRGCNSDGICYPVQNYSFEIQKKVQASFETEISKKEAQDSNNQLFNQKDNFLLILLLCLVFGATLDLTPCVLPMLSIYSATIMGGDYQSFGKKLRQNLVYLLGLSLTYCVLGLIFSQIGVAAHGVLQHPIATVVMALLLVIFALDCMGIITVRVPSYFNNAIENKIQSQKEGTLKKAFLFGALSALIATPCTSAPLAGALIYVINSNSVLKGVLMFFCLGLGMGLPLLIIGSFGSKVINVFKGKGSLFKNILAIPLLIGALYICRHLFNEYGQLVSNLTYAFCIGYFVFIVKKGYDVKLRAISALLFFIGAFTLFSHNLSTHYLLPFEEVKAVSDLDKYKGKNLIVTVSASWCTNCHELDDSLYSTDEFVDMVSDFELARFDFTDPNTPENKELAEHLKLIGVPFVAVIDKSGNVVSSYTGSTNLEGIHKMMEKIKD